MDLGTLVVLAVVGLVIYQFWHLRAIAEKAVFYANQYCNKHGLQYISLARSNAKFKAYKGKLDWHVEYQLEFSSDGEIEYTGSLICHGKHLVKVEVPAYRINT